MWVEAVPNFSVGSDPEILARLEQAAGAAEVSVLGIEADSDHGRTVLSLAGEAQNMMEALTAAAAIAIETIDLRRHSGVHPRMGAVDVIPLIPLGPTSMADAVRLSHALGQRLGAELGLPVYLYEKSASIPEHQNLAAVRRGGFEGLVERMQSDPPDYGPAGPHPSAGAVAVGARHPLIAFNCYLSTQDAAVARAIAARVRASGGGFAGVKALGLNTPERGMVQVSMNLVDYPTTTLAEAVEMVRREAEYHQVEVVSSELVGLMPLDALLDAARDYLKLPALNLEQIVELNLNASAIGQVRVASAPT